MANNRKVQGEIDKVLKKVSDQFEVYEDVYEKFNSAPSQPQKERFENELKKEIKKLQRLREQIKGLVASSDVKDKRALEETRRDIEVKMEDFKVCERETKTKAYSKEGLASNKNDPLDTPLARTEAWIKQAIQELSEQIETAEFDLKAEGAFGGGRKKRSKSKVNDDDPRVVRLDRLKSYSFRLEQLLRMLVNEEMEYEEVDEIEEDIKTFVADNGSDDFEEITDLFDVFCLPEITAEEEEEAERVHAEVAAKAAAERASLEEKKKALAAAPSLPPVTPISTPSTPTVVPVPKSQSAAVAVKDTRKMEEPSSPLNPLTKKPDTPNTPMSPMSIPSPSTGPKLTAAEVARGATKTMAATISAANSPTTGPTTGPTMGNPTMSNLSVSSMPGGNTSGTSIPEPSVLPPAQQQQPSPAPPTTTTAAAPSAAAVPSQASAATTSGALEDMDDMDAMNDDTFGDDTAPTSASLADIAAMTAAMPASGDWGRGPPGMVKSAESIEGPSETPVVPSPASQHKSALAALQELQNSIRQREAEQARAASLLDVSFRNIPIRDDVERGRPVPPRSGLTDLFPSVPLKSLNTYQAVQKLDESTLFFLFYYQQGTYQQYLAAKFLKSRGFRYHKKFHTWFQRHKKPIETSSVDETGSYIYFDFETGWFSRVKERFVFKYTYLEGDV